MAIDPKKFWDSRKKPVTDEAIAVAEKHFGVKLPKEYLALLRIHNGGSTAGFGHPSRRNTWADNYVPLDEMNGIGAPKGKLCEGSIFDTDYMTKEWKLPPRQILLYGDGHWWITLDYRQGKTPCVSWVYSPDGKKKPLPKSEDGWSFTIAPTFKDFLAGLRPRSEFEEEEDDLFDDE